MSQNNAVAGVSGKEKEKDEATISRDVLETIVSHTPLVDLVQVVCVSKTWKKAVYSSLGSLNQPKPWLFLHRQRLRSPYTTAISANAYDPHSDVWMIDVSQPSVVPLLKFSSTLRSSNSNFLFMLSPSKFSFSFDPLNLTWHHVEAPLVWRQDPIVAKVGDSVIVAGGAWDFENDPLAVEIYDIGKRKWRRQLSHQPSSSSSSSYKSNSISMPSSLKDVESSAWLSVAASSQKLYVMQKYSGLVHVFDVETCRWSKRPHSIRPHPRCFYSVLGFINRRRSLILVGLIGDDIENVEKVKAWEIGGDDEHMTCNEIGEMPDELAEKIVTMVNNDGELSLGCGIEICTAGNFVYVYNPAYVKEVVICELKVNKGGGDRGGVGCRWGCVRNFAYDNICGLDRLVFTCSEVNVEDLQRGKYKEEERNLLDEGLKRFPTFFKLWLMLGQLEECLHNLVQTKQTYESVLKHCHSCIPLWLSLANLEEKMNGLGKARAVLTMSRKKNPRNPGLWLAGVRAESWHGYKKEADILLANAIQECLNSGIL